MWKRRTCAILLIFGLSPLAWSDAPKTLVPPTPAKPIADAETTALPTPLPAERFQGRVREAYKVAGEIPDIFAGLHCYCGCDKSDGHRYLLDCFADDHGAGCNICVNEALDAHALFMTGTPPDEIRTFIDKKYGSGH